MKYLLDTNIISYALRHRDARLMQRLADAGPAMVGTSVAVQIELEFAATLRGSDRLWSAIRAFLGGIEILALDRKDAAAVASLAATLRAMGRPIGQMDTLIGGHALSRGLTLVTHNTRHFDHVEGLQVEDWCEGA